MAKVAAIPTSRQRTAQEAAAGAREDERQHRQDARADDGQYATQICEQDDQHGELLMTIGGGRLIAAGTRVSVTLL